MEKPLRKPLFTGFPSDFLAVGLSSNPPYPSQNRVKKSEIDPFKSPFKHPQTNKNTKIS